jgi:Predicted hydrolase (HAD superfamily)
MQHLFIDADDTLWENNIYFEEATRNFITFLNHSQLSPAEVQAVIDKVERQTGYGSASFTTSLITTYRQLSEKSVEDEDIQQIRQFGEGVRTHQLQLMDGVRETLAELSTRYSLVLLTKGDQEEQSLKIERSTIAHFFAQWLIVDEKNVQTYQQVVSEFQLIAQETWMIGNSPRSDINPALAAGLNAVYIPHPHTWTLEHEEVQQQGPGQLLQLTRFSELREHF